MSYNTENPVVALFYELMRDEVVPGVMEHKVVEMENATFSRKPGQPELLWELSNEHLARYAEELVRRLTGICVK